MTEEELSLEEHLELLRKQNRERKAVIIERAQKALDAARDELARGHNIDLKTIRDLEETIADYKKHTMERPGLPPEP